MIDLREFEQLKQQQAKHQREADRAEGELRHLNAELKSEFGCDNVKAGQSLLKKLEKELTEAEKEYEQKIEAFRRDYKERLRIDCT